MHVLMHVQINMHAWHMKFLCSDSTDMINLKKTRDALQNVCLPSVLLLQV